MVVQQGWKTKVWVTLTTLCWVLGGMFLLGSQPSFAQSTKPDLFVGSIAVNPTVGPPGGNVDISFELRNGGQANAGPFNVSIYFSTTATLNVSKAILLKSLVIQGLNAGSTSIQKVKVTIPTKATINQVAYLAVMADSGLSVSEDNESNNITTSTFNVKPGPDLTVDTVTVSKTTAIPGERITVNYTLKNIGRADVQPFESYIYFSSDTLIDSQDSILDRISVQYLPVANSLSLIRNITIPSNATTNQTYYLAVFVDPNSRRSEESETNNIKIIQIKVVPPSPQSYADFVVSSITLTDKQQRLGKTVYYTAVYKNQGKKDGYFYADMDYSTRSDFRTYKSWRVVYRYTLKPGATYTHKHTFQVPYQAPYDVAPQDYYIRIRLYSTTNEQDKSNNTSSFVVFKALAGQSALNIQSFNFGPTICNYKLDSNNKVVTPKKATGTVSIHNYGYVTSEPFEVALYVSDDNKISNQDILITTVSMPAIGAQKTVTKNISFDFNATIKPGSYRFAVILDPSQKLKNDELSRSRQIWLWRESQFLFSQVLPDLRIDKLVYTPSPKADVGTRVNIEAWIRNVSSQKLNSCYHRTYVRAFFADDSNLTQVKFNSPNYGLSTSSVYRLTGYIDVPGTLAPRKGFMAFQLDTSNIFQFTDNKTKIKSIPFELLPRSVDLKVVRASATPAAMAWEQSVKVDVTLTNQGTLKQVRGTRTCVWYSEDNVYQKQQDESLGSAYIDFSRTPSLTGSMTFNAKRWKVGKAYLLLQVDCDNQYKESDENNNMFVIPITVRKFLVDFVTTSMTAAPNQIRPNLTTKVRVEVKNQGQDKHIKRIGICLYLSNDQQWDTKDTLIDCKATTDIYSHFGSAEFSFSGKSTYLAGTRYLIAQIDTGYSCHQRYSWCKIPDYDETDEKNNEAKIPLFIRNDVDVTTGSVWVSKTITKVGDNLSFRFQVKNIGTVGTNTPFDVQVVFSDNEVIDKTDRLIKTIRIPALAPNKTSSDFTVSYAIPSTVQPGERYFGLLVDSKNEVVEVDETNNLGSVKVNVLIPGVDLQVVAARIDRSVIPAGKASDVTIYSDVQNFGSASSSPFTVSYYLSTDKLFDPGDTLLGSRSYTKTLPSLARTGQFVDKVQITLKQSNTFYVLVVVDPANQIKETLKGNNTRALAIQIVNRPPTISSRPPVRAIEKQLYTYQAQGFDPDNDTLSWRIARGPVGMTVDAKTGKVTWTPQSFDGGKTVDVSLEASDGRGGTTTQDYKITVQGVNDPPKIVSTAPTRALAGKAFTYTPKAVDPDTNDTQTWVLINAPTGMQIDSKTGQVTWLVPSSMAGQSTSVSIQVSDGSGANDTQAFTLQITKQNSPPAIVSKAPTLAYEGATFRYQALASDPDTGDTLAWSRVAGPTGLKIDATTGLVEWKVPVGLSTKSIDVTIRVSDQVGAFVDQKFTLKLTRNNNAPTIVSKAPLSAYVGRLFEYSPVATDPDPGDRLSWVLKKGPTGLTFDKGTGKLSWTPPQSLKGKTVDIEIEVLDSGSLSDSQSFTLKVGQYCEVDSDCSSTELCLLNLCSPPGCFQSGCTDKAKPICASDGTCKADACNGIRCTGGEFCFAGKCVPVCAYVTCGSGEKCVDGDCVVDKCVGVTCKSGERCENGKCVRDACAAGQCRFKRLCLRGTCILDPCSHVTCPTSKMLCATSPLTSSPQCVLPTPCRVDSDCKGDLICAAGVCSPPNCYDSQQACAAGKICLRGSCEDDPCKGKTCSKGQFCRDGACVDVCAGVTCNSGQQCRDGRCIANPCAAASCNPGEKCVKGLCEKNLCIPGQSCKHNRVCVDNSCIQDPCLFVTCPVAGQRCELGQCLDPPSCTLDVDCKGDLLCVRGRCVPSNCSGSNPCSQGQLCVDGECRANPCDSVTCGGNTFCREGVCVGSCSGVFCDKGEVCQFGFCRQDACQGVSCAKDEVCVQGQCRKNICAQSTKPCKQGRLCSPDGCQDSSCSQANCPQGQTCDPQTGQCSGDVACKLDQDCLGSGICEGGKCVAPGCYKTGCPSGQICWQGVCQTSPCDGKSCAANEYCNSAGKCVPSCDCPDGQRCGANGCEVDPCVKATCQPGEVCVDGTCQARCKPNSCKYGRVCTPGVGCGQDPCSETSCPSGTVCRRGYCSNPCSELECPKGTMCQAGQCIAATPEPGPEPGPEPVEEPIVTEKVDVSKEAVPEPVGSQDAGVVTPEPEVDLALPPSGCDCNTQTNGTGLGLLWLLGMLWAFRRKRSRASVK